MGSLILNELFVLQGTQISVAPSPLTSAITTPSVYVCDWQTADQSFCVPVAPSITASSWESRYTISGLPSLSKSYILTVSTPERESLIFLGAGQSGTRFPAASVVRDAEYASARHG